MFTNFFKKLLLKAEYTYFRILRQIRKTTSPIINLIISTKDYIIESLKWLKEKTIIPLKSSAIFIKHTSIYTVKTSQSSIKNFANHIKTLGEDLSKKLNDFWELKGKSLKKAVYEPYFKIKNIINYIKNHQARQALVLLEKSLASTEVGYKFIVRHLAHINEEFLRMQQENAFITKFLTTALIIGLSFAGFFFTNFLAKESFDKSIQQQNICRIIPGSQVINTSFELSKFVKKQNRIFISGFFVFDFKKDVEFFDVIENFDLRTGKILSKKTSFIKLADENDKMRIDLKLSLPADSENTFYPLLFDKCRIKIVNELMMADQSCFKIKNFISKKKEKVSAALMSYFEKKEMFDEPAIAINLYKPYSTDWIQFLSLIMFILFFSLYFAHNITGQIGLDKFLFLGYLIVAALPYLILKQSLPILSIIIASQVLSILSKVFMNAFYKTSSLIYELINLIIFSALGIIFGALILF